ncbi:sugar transferase, partial [Patulibacter sp. S7RM1-6]
PPVAAAALGAVLSAVVALALDALAARSGAVRVLVLGTREEALLLRRTLHEVRCRTHRVVAHTGRLPTLERAVVARRADLVVHTDHLPRAAVQRHLRAVLRRRPLRAMPLDAFCEHVLGVVPLDAVDDAWLAELADPRVVPAARGSRALDVVVSALLLVPAGLIIAALAPLILADGGGGVLFRQQRVGRDGRPFTILKLRTMRGRGADWSGPGDPRVTRLGALLRRTHVDELPQLVNVLRGDMALVGPRPEQVGISAALERELPLFPYRHAVRPGITGWARVRCGYARTTEESAVKLGNDLYYLKHRSLTLDVAVLLETLRLTLFERQYEVRAPAAEYVLGRPPAARAVRPDARAP